MPSIMDQKQLLENTRLVFEQCLSIMKDKNSDYADVKNDAFLNFRLSTVVGVPVERAILVRTLDKLSRIGNLIQKDGEMAVKDENIVQTALDLINYVAILIAYVSTETQMVRRETAPQHDSRDDKK